MTSYGPCREASIFKKCWSIFISKRKVINQNYIMSMDEILYFSTRTFEAKIWKKNLSFLWPSRQTSSLVKSHLYFFVVSKTLTVILMWKWLDHLSKITALFLQINLPRFYSTYRKEIRKRFTLHYILNSFDVIGTHHYPSFGYFKILEN